MERKIGEKFDFLGYTLIIEKSKLGTCNECFFYQHRLVCSNKQIQDIIGKCKQFTRQDRNNIIFILS